MTDNEQDMGEPTMLDLFRQEVEAQAAILNNGLSILQTQPQSAKVLESLMQAAHSLKGVAQLIEIDAAVNLTHIMEDCFLAAQQQTITLGAQQIDWLLHGVNLLRKMSLVEEENLESWLSEYEQEIEATRNGIAAIPTSGTESTVKLEAQTLRSAEPESLTVEMGLEDNRTSQQATVQTILPASELLPELPSAELRSEEPAPDEDTPQEQVLEPAIATAATQTPAGANEIPNFDGTSMLDLFRLEVDAQAAILNEGLLALESQPESAKVLESLMRAAHSVKGAARIVAIDAAVNLAHVMEDCFVAAQKHTITLGADEVDVLLHGVDLLLNISQVEARELNRWLAQQGEDIETTRQEIAAILKPGFAPVSKRKVEAQATIANDSKTQTQEALPQAKGEIVTTPLSTQTQPIAAKHPVESASITMQTPSNLKPASPPTGQPAEASADRVVRVSAENLNRIMGLAGESLIEANWLQPFADSLMILKKRQLELSKLLQEIQETMAVSRNKESDRFLVAAREKERECREILGDRLDQLELYARRTGSLSDRLYREVIASNMRPFADGVGGFPRMIRDLARKLGKQVKFEILGKATPVDRDILKKLEAPLTHILRNCVDHGLESPEERAAAGKPVEGTVRLEAIHRGGMLAISISDDGRGIDVERLRQKVIDKGLTTAEMAEQLSDSELLEFLFLPGFSTAKQVTEISGRGVGLDIAKSMAQAVGGNVRASSQQGKGTSFYFQLPLTLSVVRTLLVEISGEPYAFPLARIEQIVMVNKEDISSVENRQYFTMDNKNIGLVPAYQVLELKESAPKSDALPAIVICEQSDYYGLVVDRFLGEHDLVVRPLDPRLGKVQDISAAALMGDGTPILIVDVSDLVRSVDNLLDTKRLSRIGSDIDRAVGKNQKSILVVDDSITVREMERKLLQNKGYKVDVAVDGMEGWYTVSSNHYDLVVTDIDMPRMNGIELVNKIKDHSKLKSIPVIIVSYKDREEDRLRGMEAGADYYLTKASFHDDSLLNAVVDLIGN
ncbi:response regulator [Allocoleopsis sp.]|uniref:response regulator n=1 Tax=Allocoleopsis sp. TaxID=3088169 RepID=UPI002FD4BEF4